MAAYTAVSAKHATLTTTTVDTVTLTGPGRALQVRNRHATENLTIAFGTTAPSDPTALGDDLRFVAPGEWRTFTVTQYANTGLVVKLIGNGNGYSVELG